MEVLPKTKESEFSLKSIFSPFTNLKAIHFLIIIGFVVFANTLFNAFIGDDIKYIANSPGVHTINFVYAFLKNNFNIAGQYRPLTEIYFSILYTFFGTSPFFYHLLQLLLHIVCTILIFLLFRKFFSVKISFYLGLIFLIHPLNVESVVNIAHTDSPLFLMTGLITFFISIKKDLKQKDYLLIFTFFLFSLLIKEAAILFLFTIEIYRYLFVKKKIINISLVFLFSFFTYLIIRIFIGQIYFGARELSPIAELSLFGRIQNIPNILYYYFHSFLFPTGLAVYQQGIIPQVDFNYFYLPLLFDVTFITFLGLGIFMFWKRFENLQSIIFFSFWFLLGIGLYIQIIPLEYTVADRWFYFPMIGLLGILGLVLKSIDYKSKVLQTSFLAGAGIILIFLSLITITRNSYWTDPIKLYTHDIKNNDNFEIENELGIEYQKRGDYKNALISLKKSVAFRPYEYNLFDIGVIYENTGNIEEAKKYYRMALDSKSYNLFYPHQHDLGVYIRYGYTLVFFDKDISNASKFIDTALKDYPDSYDLWLLKGLIFYKNGDKTSALEYLKKSYEIYPNEQNTSIYNSIKANNSFDINIDGKIFTFK